MPKPLINIDAPSPGQALAFVNGRVFTARDGDAAWASAVAVRDGVILAVGTDEEVRRAADTDAVVVDLDGRTAMPGIHDAHTHLLFSGLKFRFECRVAPDADADGVVRDLTSCHCGAHDPEVIAGRGGWVVGGEFNPLNFGPEGPDRAFLDEAFPDRPVFLWDYTVHHGLANSAALAAGGIDANAEDPVGGRIVRRAGTAEPTGELVERATWPVQRAIPAYAPELCREAIRWAAGQCHRFGITSVQEASAGPAVLRAFRELDEAEELNLRVAAHIVWREEGFGMASSEELDALIADSASAQTTRVRTSFVKLWLDGAPLPPHRTHAGLTAEGEVDGSRILFEEGELHAALQRFDAEGRGIKIHCAGEGAVRVALDAIEAVRRANGTGGPTHEVAHSGFVDVSDLPRFARLNVVAEMSPAIWHRREPEFRVLDGGFKFRTLVDAGAPVTIGSDWILTSDPNLFPALQGVLERGDEALPLETALRVLTVDGAKVVGLDATTGSLEAGRSADLIVLDRDLTATPVSEVGGTQVLLTMFEGRPVHQTAGQ